MLTLSKWRWMAAALIVITTTVGCGGSQSTPANNGGGAFGSASLRVVVLNPSAGPVNVSVDGSTVSSSLPYLGDTGYVPIKSRGLGPASNRTLESRRCRASRYDAHSGGELEEHLSS
jgi:hypothetical protein